MNKIEAPEQNLSRQIPKQKPINMQILLKVDFRPSPVYADLDSSLFGSAAQTANTLMQQYQKHNKEREEHSNTMPANHPFITPGRLYRRTGLRERRCRLNQLGL